MVSLNRVSGSSLGATLSAPTSRRSPLGADRTTLTFNALSQPLAGRAYAFFSQKYTFLFSVLLFELGSVVSAVAQSSTVFIVGRALQGYVTMHSNLVYPSPAPWHSLFKQRQDGLVSALHIRFSLSNR